MRGHAKASSAGSNSGNGNSRALFGRAAAIRGASRDGKGSGAPSGPLAQGVLVLAVAALVLLAFAPAAFAGKIVDRIVSGAATTGTTAGLFNTPRGIAVNYANVADATTDPLGASTDGYVYVADNNNQRIQVFRPDGTFRFMFGRGVQSGGDGAQICDASELPCQGATTVDDEQGEFDDPQGIAINQTTGHLYVRDRDNRRVQEFEADGDFVRMWGYDVATAASPDDTGTGFEICASLCKIGTTGNLGGQLASSSSNSTGIAVVPAGAPNAGNVAVADPGNRRIQEFGSAGAFIRAWGWDVISPGGTGEVTVPLNEVQTVKVGNGAALIDGGSYTLTFNGQTTAPLGFESTVAQVDAALEALPSIGAGNVVVSGPTFDQHNDVYIERIVEFTGTLGVSDVPAITGNGSNLVMRFGALATADVTTTVPGGSQPSFEICTVAAQCKAATSSLPANMPGSFASSNPTHLAVDAGGTVYASDSTLSNRVQRFDSTKAVAAELARSAIPVTSLTSTSSEPATSGLAVDPTNGNLFVARGPVVGVLEISDPDGTPGDADRHYQGASLNPTGIAIDSAGDDLYLSTGTGVSNGGHRLYAADDDGAPAPILTVSPPTSLAAHSATLNGTVNPNGGFATTYRFQYSRNGVTWTDVAPAFDLGNGTSPIAVDDVITGLEANTFYRVRIVAQKPLANPQAISAELTFLTDAIGPELRTLHPQTRTDTTARLTGVINPNNLPTTYRFQYGPTAAYGSVAPVPDGSVSGGTDKLVYADVGGLSPAATYHYRLVATNAEGTTIGDDVVFKTRATVPSAGARAYEMVTPPFKATRANVTLGRAEYNVNPGLPSLAGDAVVWKTAVFPLTEDVGAPADGDNRLLRRTAGGWTNQTLNSLPFLYVNASGNQGSIQGATGSSGDLSAMTWNTNRGLLPVTGPISSAYYMNRPGTGSRGITAWLADTYLQKKKFGLKSEGDREAGLFNDEGTVVARSAEYRDVAEDFGTTSNEDPSGEQQLYGTGPSNANGGRTVYLQRASNPDLLPNAPKDLVNECTGVGPSATKLPARIGSGAATDTIGTQACTESVGTPKATGTGTVAHGSATVTGVTTSTGAFSPGQIVSGDGISGATRIIAVGAGTLTLSANVEARASFFGELTSGSNKITVQFAQTGTYEVGQTVTAPGIPAGTTVAAIETPTGLSTVLTVSQAATATSSFTTVLLGAPGPVIALTAEDQHITSDRGAVTGAGGDIFGTTVETEGPLATAASNDGRRIFFTSPDPKANGLPPSCTTDTGFGTSCPPQLFVRQYDANGENPQVRWISHSRSVAAGEGAFEGGMIASQRVAEFGAGVIFQGASRDGRNVYFKTNAPLTPDDPNAGVSITTESAQANSWDLYRYELPASLSADPDDGKLTRITGGPSGSADPNAVRVPLRFLSDGGDRAYLVTRAPIAGADSTAPSGGSTTPGGTVTDNTIRNLYLYDANKSGPARYSFIGRLPSDSHWNNCATTTVSLGRQIETHSSVGIAIDVESKCIRGTADGSHLLFSTRGQLTSDDRDDAGDLYLYDAEVDELTRVTAPPPGADTYVCEDDAGQFDLPSETGGGSIPITDCNGDLGWAGNADSRTESLRGWGGLRYENIAKDANGVVSVFFESRSELVPEDTNGNRYDVYQWRQGKLSLISTGDSKDNSWFSGNSVDGRDVFFVTSKAIDPREIDAKDFDIYDARIGGGFPYLPPSAPCDVLAFGCEAEATAAPQTGSANSTTTKGAGNVLPSKPKACNKGKVRRKGKCVAKTKQAKKTKRANQSRRAYR